MGKEMKKVLIVDDCEIDRTILNIILNEDFEVVEMDNGYSALEYMRERGNSVDAVLLDVSMPVIDGFSVLRLMRENKIENIPVFMITSESTKDNVEKAAKYNVAGFMKKPFDSDTVINRLKAQFGIAINQKITNNEYEATVKYIEKLENAYKKYLANMGKKSVHYEHMTDLMRILLEKYCARTKSESLSKREIELISKAAFFCDIGFMMLPREYGVMWQDEWNAGNFCEHPKLGEQIIQLNTDERCKYFVSTCSNICLHHHERYDGTGFPDAISGIKNSAYAQICRMVDELDEGYLKSRKKNYNSLEDVIRDMSRDNGMVSQEIFSLLLECQNDIKLYYNIKESEM